MSNGLYFAGSTVLLVTAIANRDLPLTLASGCFLVGSLLAAFKQ